MIFKDDITIEQYKAISSKRPILPQLNCKAKHHLLHEHNGASVFFQHRCCKTLFSVNIMTNFLGTAEKRLLCEYVYQIQAKNY